MYWIGGSPLQLPRPIQTLFGIAEILAHVIIIVMPIGSTRRMIRFMLINDFAGNRNRPNVLLKIKRQPFFIMRFDEMCVWRFFSVPWMARRLEHALQGSGWGQHVSGEFSTWDGWTCGGMQCWAFGARGGGAGKWIHVACVGMQCWDMQHSVCAGAEMWPDMGYVAKCIIFSHNITRFQHLQDSRILTDRFWKNGVSKRVALLAKFVPLLFDMMLYFSHLLNVICLIATRALLHFFK